MLLLFIAYALALSAALGLRGYRAKPAMSAGTATPAGTAGTAQRISRVLIVGATGGTGRQLVAQALERGYHVTALVRDPSKLAADHPRLAVMRGDVLDPESVGAAMRGQEAVVSALGHKRFFYPTRILSQGTANLLDAMTAHGVRRFVCETTLGIGSSAGRMGLYYTLFIIPVILPFYFSDKTRQERRIAASRADWVIVRPGMLTNGAKRGRYRVGSGVGSFLLTVRISRADVAAFMLDQLERDALLGTAVSVAW
ncbi:MAG: SDR family oxidoreductase [Acidobacteriota bacterium]|nr:SDR family oxidoreductase [Acidobacteriota bacterium]